MTLGPKFVFCNKMAVTQRRSNLFPKFRKIPAAPDEYFWDMFLKNCMRPRIRRLRFTWILAPGGRLSDEAYIVERYDTYNTKIKIIKVRINAKLLNLYFVVRPCKPTKNKTIKSKDEKNKYEI